MTGKNKSPWILRRANALELAERLVGGTKAGLPTNLAAAAKRRLVQQIQFRPLLTDGGIAVLQDGFKIYVRCEPGEGDDLTSRFEEDGTGATLPARLVNRARFTIAHEISHTFFYDISKSPPRLKVDLKSAKMVQSLETSCNRVAGELLLPGALMNQKCGTNDLTVPRHLSTLASTALVSKETLILRFQRRMTAEHPYGIIASIAFQNGNWTITAISKHYALDDLFPKAMSNAPLTALIDHPDFIPFGGEMETIEMDVHWSSGKKKKMKFSCDLSTRKRSTSSTFVTVKPIDEL